MQFYHRKSARTDQKCGHKRCAELIDESISTQEKKQKKLFDELFQSTIDIKVDIFFINRIENV